MQTVKVLWNCFEKKLCIKTLERLVKQTGFCTLSQEKVKFHSSDLEMNETIAPPENVYGMKVLDRSAFKRNITVTSVSVENQNLKASLKLLKTYLLKISSLNSIREVDDNKKIILLNPIKAKGWHYLDKDMREKLQGLNIQEDSFSSTSVELGYENWKASDLLKAILPKDEPPFSSFSQIGHIIHLNLKDHLLDYKQIIGEILLDKVSNTKTVVYKKGEINSKYRTFDMEVICGEPNFMVSVKEYGCIFEFDFSKVYWNPRLSTEHARIVSKTNTGDVLFDVFAGVGPFAIPAAKKKCMVYANDLNPDSFKWLDHNVSLNKKCHDYIKTYNKDGSDFILTDIKEQLLKIWQDECFIGNIYIVMNLPALAPTFLAYFKGLIKEDDLRDEDFKNACLPIIHCYLFRKKENERELFEKQSGMSLDGVEHTFYFVRGVSNNTDMFRVTFTLPKDYLFEKSRDNGSSGHLSKKMRTS